MDNQELLSTVRGIVASIDDEVEVDMPYTSRQFERDMYSVRLSKWGIRTVLEISFRDIVNARPDDRELRARLAGGIQHIGELRDFELTVHGTVAMLKPLLCHYAAEHGLFPERSSGQPDGTRGEWAFASFRINKRGTEGRSDSVGTICMQDLPRQRALVTFRRTASGKLPSHQHQEHVVGFRKRFIARLAELGFVEKTEPPKAQMGFTVPSGGQEA
ncbi:unnamed protein product [marine sediment metagenome]|uniref:Uncharacterized protein n=1 Tax=marine sediment metagenome TaxID=412755 RepID=X1KLU8_9ZZZZ